MDIIFKNTTSQNQQKLNRPVSISETHISEGGTWV
jgi:hypothetical protein